MLRINQSINSILIALVSLFAFSQTAAGQEWKGITPLVSTCADVKKLLKVSECRLPWMRYESAKYDLTIDFADGKRKWTVPKGTVASVLVVFHDLLRLSDYETQFDNYLIKPESDIPEVLIYTNDKAGIRLSVQTKVAREPYISSILFYPSAERKKKLARRK